MGYADISTLKLPINLQFEERVENRGLFQANSRKINKEKIRSKEVTFGKNGIV